MTDIQPYLQRMVDRAADPGVQTSLAGFDRTLHFQFTDTNEEWVIRFEDGHQASLSQETVDAPDLTVITTTGVLAGVMDKKINPMSAYMQRKIQTKGSLEDLMRLQKLML